jgi:hypothetical protein
LGKDLDERSYGGSPSFPPGEVPDSIPPAQRQLLNRLNQKQDDRTGNNLQSEAKRKYRRTWNLSISLQINFLDFWKILLKIEILFRLKILRVWSISLQSEIGLISIDFVLELNRPKKTRF